MGIMHVISLAAATLAAGPMIANGHQEYELTNLSALAGGRQIDPTGINSTGRVIGISFLYENGALKILSPPRGYQSIDPTSINDSGRMAAVVYSNCVLGQCVPNPAVYLDGKWQELFDPANPVSPIVGVTTGINDKGHIIGYTLYNDGSGIFEFVNGPSFLYVDGTVQYLPTIPDGADSLAYGINSNGEVTGVAHLAGFQNSNAPGTPYAFSYFNGHLKNLGTPMGYSGGSVAYALNDRGEIAASAYADVTGIEEAFVYHDGEWRKLGAVKDYPNSEGHGINAEGDVIGTATQSEYDQVCSCYPSHAFVYVDGTMKDLNSLIPGKFRALYTLTSGIGINDRGQIVAIGYAVSDPTRTAPLAILLTPASAAADTTTDGTAGTGRRVSPSE